MQELSWKCALLERERAPFMLAAAEGEGEEATLVLEKMYSGRGERMAAAVIWLSLHPSKSRAPQEPRAALDSALRRPFRRARFSVAMGEEGWRPWV